MDQRLKRLDKIEAAVAERLEALPHLPEGLRVWLGANVWWIVAIGAVVSAIAAFTLLPLLFGAAALLSFWGSYGYVSSVNIIDTVISVVFLAVQAVLLFMAIQPLKDKDKKGWTLLFAVYLVGVAGSLVSVILALGRFDFIPSLIGAAVAALIGVYLVFEVRSQFGPKKKAPQKITQKSESK